MKKITVLTLLILSVLTLTACQITINKEEEAGNDNNDTTTEENNVVVEGLEQIDIEVGETYDLRYSVKNPKGLTVSTTQTDILTINNNVFCGIKVGEANIELKQYDTVQNVKVTVHAVGALSNSFTICKERMAGKSLVAFGDSVTYSSSANGQPENTYPNHIAFTLKMSIPSNTYINLAIGGSTGTYMYPGSSIAKEYENSVGYIDGVSVVKNLYDEGSLADVDYAIIAFGHNDQYFQPPLTAPGDDVYDVNSFASCNSFKGSYRHMIQTLQLANPSMRVIILGCTYSEYQLTNPSRYGNTYNYDDYRQAMKEVAEEFNLTYIDPWDYMRSYFDCYDNEYYYRDTVHLTVEGHKLLANYICNYR